MFPRADSASSTNSYIVNGADETTECYRKRFNTDGISGMIDMDTSTSEMLTKKYIHYYHILREEVKYRTGKYPKEYRDGIHEEGIERFFENFREDNKTIQEISVEILSKLISLQALPNMNHRTTIVFTRVFLLSNEAYLYEYDERKWEYDRFSEESKHAILSERNLLSQMGNADEEDKEWITENCLGEHLAVTMEYFNKLIQSGNPVAIPRNCLKAAFSNGDSP